VPVSYDQAMRALAIVVLLASAARADELDEPVEARHPEWIERSAKTIDMRRRPISTETWRYDAAGKLYTYTYDDDRGAVHDLYTWDADGRLATHEQRTNTRVERRDFTYKLDASGRVLVREIRDPAHTDTFARETWTWSPDGSRTVARARVDSIGQSYADGNEVYDAAGRRTRDCIAHAGCSMYEYDAHGRVARVREQIAGGEHYYRVYERDYDGAGRLTREKVGGTETAFAYDARGDLTSSARLAAGALKTYTKYTYARR
jgi:YD repeat-containing protein